MRDRLRRFDTRTPLLRAPVPLPRPLLYCSWTVLLFSSDALLLHDPVSSADTSSVIRVLSDSAHESEEAVAAANAAAAVARTNDVLEDLRRFGNAAKLDSDQLATQSQKLQSSVREARGQADRAAHAVLWTQHALAAAKTRLAEKLAIAEQNAAEKTKTEAENLEKGFLDWRFAALHDDVRDAEEAGFVAAQPFTTAAEKIQQRIGEFRRSAELAGQTAFSLRARAASMAVIARNAATQPKTASTKLVADKLGEQAREAEARADGLAREVGKLEESAVKYEQASDFAAAEAANRIDGNVAVCSERHGGEYFRGDRPKFFSTCKVVVGIIPKEMSACVVVGIIPTTGGPITTGGTNFHHEHAFASQCFPPFQHMGDQSPP